MFYVFSFESLRAIALYSHFLLTTFLIWTMRDQIESTLEVNYNPVDFDEARDSYYTLLTFALIGIVTKAVAFSLTYHSVTLASAMNLFLDVAGSFFVGWIVLDGMDWNQYAVVFIFCM
jgi:hypothetical protein